MRTSDVIAIILVFLSTAMQSLALDCISCQADTFDDGDSCYNPPSSSLDISTTIGVSSTTCDTGEVCRVKSVFDYDMISLERGCFDSETFCDDNTVMANTCDATYENCYQCCNEDYCNTGVPDVAATIRKMSAFVVMATSMASLVLAIA